MILPEGLKQAFWEDLKRYEADRQMPDVTSVEQIGCERGIQEGRKQGQGLLILQLLARKFGPLSQPLHNRLHQLSPTPIVDRATERPSPL